MHDSVPLLGVLKAIPDAAIAVSGGVDSLTLATAAYDAGLAPLVVHGKSPAVPEAATARVRDFADRQGWRLQVVDAGEFGDPRYRANPINRCYFCKSNLYAMIASLSQGTILSGANLDDLGDYRPGLRAAAERNVRHPFIEAKMTKAAVRSLARRLQLPELASLPASPCLSSRVETGIAIDSSELSLIDRTEVWLRENTKAQTVRLRRRVQGWVVELDEANFARADLTALQTALFRALPELTERKVRIEPYRRGSAFVGDKSATS